MTTVIMTAASIALLGYIVYPLFTRNRHQDNR